MFVSYMKAPNMCYTLKMSIMSLLLSSYNVFAMESVTTAESFITDSKWNLVISGTKSGDIRFLANRTITSEKPFKLGNKFFKFWEIAEHPINKGVFLLRVQANKSSGWYSFNWNKAESSWVSKNWPKHKITK